MQRNGLRKDVNMQFEHIGLYAQDPEALAQWYCDTLGFKVIKRLERGQKPPVFFLAACSGMQLEILPTERPRLDKDVDSPGFSHLGIVVDDFSSMEQYLSAKGVKLWGVRTTSSGWKIGYFCDPEGNILEVVQR